jgi:hypothetical protein
MHGEDFFISNSPKEAVEGLVAEYLGVNEGYTASFQEFIKHGGLISDINVYELGHPINFEIIISENFKILP